MVNTPPFFSILTVRPSLPTLELESAEEPDAASSISSESQYFDAAESIFSHDESEITKPTEITTVDDRDDVSRSLSPFHAPRCTNQDQDIDKLFLQDKTTTGPAQAVHGTCISDLSDGEADDATPGVTWTGTDKDLPAIKLDRSRGPGRHNYKVGSREENESDIQFDRASTLNINVPWKHPRESTSEAWKVIQRVERLGVLQDLSTTSQSAGAGNIHSVPGPLTAALDNLMPATHCCATEDKSPPTEAPWQAVSSQNLSNAARQTQVHEFHGAIHRLMPPGQIIYFGMDVDSFRQEGITRYVTDRILDAALDIVRVFRKRNLGIDFAYMPKSASAFNVFNIRYDLTLGTGTLAQAFLPSDSRRTWQLGISRRLALSGIGSRGYLDYLPNILAHEFMHILGLRHWNAGFHASEMHEPSVLWPKTVEGNRESVMNTGVHPSQLRFSDEDFRVIREMYSTFNGALCAGRKIIDIDPYNGPYVA
ncbi:hypothetical protein J7T55_001372 [Diaporthe amygdali]|uniref:uncharacterized protein n=1 Tax=Phomopsis amygdali TaxID=1214568 RepID=UPI0022FDFC7D|nr:uncharacterized protein J7T55_001372 [Diaporthe amygdali]KAJ0103753.1 hypothetical protein J7T55_001372 [Diaporthe amygdali]